MHPCACVSEVSEGTHRAVHAALRDAAFILLSPSAAREGCLSCKSGTLHEHSIYAVDMGPAAFRPSAVSVRMYWQRTQAS